MNEGMYAELKFEADYWHDCTNTFDEERKQYVYAECMGLPIHHHRILIPQFRILDVGGGPVSMLLKVPQVTEGLIWDPLVYPEWTRLRYRMKNIQVRYERGEDLNEQGWDEVWLYNCLQHTQDPALVLRNCLRAGKRFRIFEWLDIPPHEGHPQMLTKTLLDEWLGVQGQTREFDNHFGCTGKAYFAVVPGAG